MNILHGAIHAALAAAGLAPRRERPIAPHMTLLRDVRIASPEPIAPMVWRVREFVLLNS